MTAERPNDASPNDAPEIGPFAEAVWTTPFGMPPFDRIRTEHYLPAFERALQAHEGEVDAIARATQPPRFDNTVGALELSLIHI